MKFDDFIKTTEGVNFETFVSEWIASNKPIPVLAESLLLFIEHWDARNRRKMTYPMADMYDRYSIEMLKHVRANANNALYLEQFREQLDAEGFHPEFFEQLYEINGKIWDLESDIRKGKEGELGLEEVGRRAIEIRNLNNVRIAIKNEVAKHFDEILERKYNHASA